MRRSPHDGKPYTVDGVDLVDICLHVGTVGGQGVGRAVMMTGVSLTNIALQSAAWTTTAYATTSIVAKCRGKALEERLILAPKITVAWAQRVNRIFGVTIEYTERTQRMLAERCPRVLLFNHCSTYDVVCVGGLLPSGGVIVAKEELLNMPFVGSGLNAMGSIFLNRSDRQASYDSLMKAGQRLRSEQLQVLIAPEGRRSDSEVLQRFRLGAFQLAALSEAPVVPIVIHGAHKVWPKGAFAPQPGRIVVDVLETMAPPLSSDRAALIDYAERTRNLYLQAMETGPVEDSKPKT